MAKTKINNVHLPLVIIGYTLFALLAVSTLLSTTIPFGGMLFDPRVLHVNVAVTAIALTVGSILPVLTGYLIGSHSVKTKNTLSHHFNGVLFGLLAYGLVMMTIFVTVPDDFIADRNARLLLLNILPALAVAVVTTILAVAHVKSSRAKNDVLEYAPFSVLLIVSILAMPLWSLMSAVVANTLATYSFVPLIVTAILGLISYTSLRKSQLTHRRKVIWSAVSIAVAFVTMYVSSQFVYAIAVYVDPRPTMETQAITSWVGLIVALLVWVVYWTKQVKALPFHYGKK